ncbi:MAG: SHOCT domain-containing protein [Actinomycetota bacterium]
MWRPDGPMHETAWWSSWQGAVVICLLLVVAGLLIWLIVRSRETPTGGSARAGHGDDEAVALARMRYARGELDRDGFARIMQDLTGRSPAAEPRASGMPESTEPSTPPEPPGSPTTEPA